MGLRRKIYIIFFIMCAFTVLGNTDAARMLRTSQYLQKPIAKKIDVDEGSTDIGGPPVTLSVTDQYAIMDNGIVKLTLTIPGGHMTGIEYGGLEVLDWRQKERSRGYWDLIWDSKNNTHGQEGFDMQNFKVIKQDENQVELSFSTQWNGNPNLIPLNADKRFIMLRGSSGFYNYMVLDHDGSFPATTLGQFRVVFKLLRNKFRYLAVSDDIQKIMPTEQDYNNGQPLAFKEAILYTNSSDPLLKTAVEDKYQYSLDMKDQQVHGWISLDDSPIGFWLVKPTTEYYSGGPFKQELTSHMGPTSLIDFLAGHYGSKNFQLAVEDGEKWHKVFGPYFVYLNKASTSQDSYAQLWSDAKDQLKKETDKWPYDFPLSENYAKPNQRGSVEGQLFIRDRYMSNELIPANSAWVGLAAPGEEGSWQTETKGYQFWTKANNDGKFTIKGVVEGEYTLFAWISGLFGEYKHSTNIKINPGDQINLANIVFEPPRNGPTLWEIGIPDRTAAEFFVPDPSPEYVNSALLTNEKNKYRQYGLWEKYTDRYPNEDVVYTVGESDYTKDWFYAHVSRRTNNKELRPTTWEVQFPLQNVNPYQSYTLRIALASASNANLRVRFNENRFNRPQYIIGRIGGDNAIARHGIHGLYWRYSFQVSGSWLLNGMNTLYLTQAVADSLFSGLMYDYLRFEGPSS